MTTISADHAGGVLYIPSSYTSPVVVDAGITISNTNDPLDRGSYPGIGDGIFVSGAAELFTIQNDGTVFGSTLFDNGVYLAAGGFVTNAASALIEGYNSGVEISGSAGAVVNYGRILGLGIEFGGVDLTAGGSVTNAASASIIGDDVAITGGIGTIVNDGTIRAQVLLASGGSVTNAASATITTGYRSVEFTHGGTLINSGSIGGMFQVGSSVYEIGIGVYFDAGGSVTNAASASITASFKGVFIEDGAGTVVNYGSIAGTGSDPDGVSDGVQLFSGGSVTNATSASIVGNTFGVHLSAGGTLSNAGTIIGSGGTAVAFGGAGSNLLMLDPGYRFSGLVIGSASASNTLELASAVSAGTVTGLGTQFTNFGPIEFDAGSRWSITGNTSGLAGEISGFAPGDTIELTGVAEVGTSYNGGIMTLDETGGGSATLDLPGSFTDTSFEVVPEFERDGSDARRPVLLCRNQDRMPRWRACGRKPRPRRICPPCRSGLRGDHVDRSSSC